jgi:ribosomal protein S18 acetylase RimI-like enzyme
VRSIEVGTELSPPSQRVPMMKIRTARKTDIPPILGLLEQMDAQDGRFRVLAITAAHLEAVVFSPNPNPSAEACVAEVDGDLVALAAFRMSASTFATFPELYLDDLFVAAAFRRRGVAKALLAELARIALARSATRILLNVQADNLDAIAFYHSVGGEVFAESRACSIDQRSFSRLSESRS